MNAWGGWVLRKAGEPIAFPSCCAFCSNEGVKNELLDTFVDMPGNGGRIYSCVPCLAKGLAALQEPVVLESTLRNAQADVDRLAGERNTLASQLTDIGKQVREKDGLLVMLQAELDTTRSSRDASDDSVRAMREEIREMRLNGGKTMAEVQAETVAAAVVSANVGAPPNEPKPARPAKAAAAK